MSRVPSLAASAVAAVLGAACTDSSPAADASHDVPEAATDAGPDSRVVDDAASAACAPGTDPSHVSTAERSSDGQGWCCQPGYPTCGCGYFGGFVHDRCQCGQPLASGSDRSPFGVCDLAPPDWIMETDVHGCSAYRARPTPTACCNCPDSGAAGH